MKILAFSDVHLDLIAAEHIVAQAEDADLVIGAGDYAIKQRGLEKVIKVLSRLNVPTVLVPGNHDDISDLRTACTGWEYVEILHGQATEIKGVRIFGLGYETPRSNEHSWNRFLTETQAGELLATEMSCDILVTHAPPVGIADQQFDGSHAGSRAIREFVEERQPHIHLCGHIHASWGKRGKIGRSHVQNLGPTSNWFQFHSPPSKR